MWDKRAEYLSNNDANSVKMVLDQGFGDTKLVNIRLVGIYAPELSQPGGPECQKFVKDWFTSNNPTGTRWGFIVTTSRVNSQNVAFITAMDHSSNLNAELADFMHEKGYKAGV